VSTVLRCVIPVMLSQNTMYKIMCIFTMPKKTSYYIVYLMVSVEQPDDGQISGPKHVVVIYYIVLFMI